LVAVLALAAVFAALPAPSAHAGGLLIFVDTTEDLPGTSGNCSLREAILASNTNSNADECIANGGGFDGIEFALGAGTPVINIGATPLPTITDHVAIDGGLDRVELRGPGGGFVADRNGLTIAASAPQTRISRLVINSFQDNGIRVDANNVTLTGNYIGTNVFGTAAAGNAGTEVSVAGASISIGGEQGTTPGGGCTGDCNLIAAVGGGFSSGIFLESSAINAGILGNFIGSVDVTGSNSIGTAGSTGIATLASGTLIGGVTPERRNVISGSGQNIAIVGPLAGVVGNYVGTNSAGTAALPGNGFGIIVSEAEDAGITGNVISGHSTSDGIGIWLTGATSAGVYANLIGTAADGSTPLPNGGDGIRIAPGTGNRIGDPAQGFGNTIANNGGAGVRVDGFNAVTISNEIRGNSIHDNGGLGIETINDGNNETPPPLITSAMPVTGTACVSCEIDVFSDDADEGRVYEGSVVADATGNWTFNGPVSGPNVTATSTDPTNDTSEFSAPFTLPVATPTPSPSPSPTPTPTPTAAPTPTVTPVLTTTPTSGPVLVQGDVNCDGDIDDDDFTLLLEFIAELTGGQQSAPCPDVNEREPITGRGWGDVSCDDELTGLDALFVLLFWGDLDTPPPAGQCFEMGDPIVAT